MSFNEIWRKTLYNFKQGVTKVALLLLTTYIILSEPPQQSGITLIVYCILCYCSMAIGHIHLLAIMYFFLFFFTPRCPNVCFLWAYCAWNKLFYSSRWFDCRFKNIGFDNPERGEWNNNVLRKTLTATNLVEWEGLRQRMPLLRRCIDGQKHLIS